MITANMNWNQSTKSMWLTQTTELFKFCKNNIVIDRYVPFKQINPTYVTCNKMEQKLYKNHSNSEIVKSSAIHVALESQEEMQI